jgi:CheY-like chemotaxis protein
VLVIDDEETIRMLCRVNLAVSGIEVLEAADGETGLEMASSERPDLILLDVMMPGLDGWEVARRLAADPATREIPVVFLTARAGYEDRLQGEQVGAVGYVVKPFDPVSIATVVDLTLARMHEGEVEAMRHEITHPPKETG